MNWQWHFHEVALHPLIPDRITKFLEVLIFVEGGKPENLKKNPRSREENQRQPQPTCDIGSGNQTRVTAVGGECSHHCAIPAPHVHDFVWTVTCRNSCTALNTQEGTLILWVILIVVALILSIFNKHAQKSVATLGIQSGNYIKTYNRMKGEMKERTFKDEMSYFYQLHVVL